MKTRKIPVVLFFLFIMIFVPGSGGAQELLQDATALVKPELFSHLDAREEKPYGMILHMGSGTVTVKNTRNGTSADITLIDPPAGVELQPNTIYINTRAADSIGLTARSCFVDISYLSSDNSIAQKTMSDELTLPEEGETVVETDQGFVEGEETDIPDQEHLTDSSVELGTSDVVGEGETGLAESEPAYDTSTILSFDDLEKDAPPDMIADEQTLIKTEREGDSLADPVDGDNVDGTAIEEDAVVEDFHSGDEDDIQPIDSDMEIVTIPEILETTDETLTAELPDTEETTESVPEKDHDEIVYTIPDTIPELDLPDDDVVYFLEPSDFRPPAAVDSEKEGTISRGKVSLPPLKGGRAQKTDPPQNPQTLKVVEGQVDSNGFYVQIGVYGNAQVLEKTAGRITADFRLPVVCVPARGKDLTRLLLGPFTRDEIGVILYKIHSSGYSDAFIVRFSR